MILVPCTALLQLYGFQGQNRASRDSLRPKLPSTLPTLLGAFGITPLVSLQPLSSNSILRGSNLSAWQPYCYVTPDAAYETGVSAPASIFKGDASHTHRAATVATGDQKTYISERRT